MKRIVLAYSGSVTTSAAIPWLAQHFDAEVVTVTLDFGQERELATIRERALNLGALRAHVLDVREELVRDYLLPALQAGALEDGYPLTTPLIAKRLVDVARMESASAIAHGAAAGGPSEAAFAAAVTSVDPALDLVAPVRVWGMSEPELLAFARERGVHVPPPTPYRTQASVWGRVVTAAEGTTVPEEAFILTRSPEECPDDPAIVDVQFAAGVPVRTNGVEMSMIEMMESLETIAGAHGVGRNVSDSGSIESPAVAVLAIAHRELEALVLGDDLALLKRQLARVYADAVLSGRWFSDLREAIDAFAGVVQKRVTGTVRLKLAKAKCVVVSRESAYVAGASLAPVAPKVVA